MTTVNDHLKLYWDQNRTTLIENNVLDLGTIKAGDSKVYTIYVYNSGWGEFYDLNFVIEHPEVTVIQAPDFINAKTIKKLELKWQSTLDVTQPQKAELQITGKGKYFYFEA